MAKRYVSFRFDDGFLQAARKAAECLAPDHASFFLIADLVTGRDSGERERLFRGREFGSVDQWREFARSGQDIQLHGLSHTPMDVLSDEDQQREIVGSLSLTKRLHDGPYVFCHPFNRLIDADFSALGISAAGFETRTSDETMPFHRLNEPVDLLALTSWAVRERHLPDVIAQLRTLPADSWVILAFHSFDGEGHEPWSVVAFKALVRECRALGLKIVTVGKMVQALSAAKTTPAPPADFADR